MCMCVQCLHGPERGFFWGLSVETYDKSDVLIETGFWGFFWDLFIFI